MINVDISNVWGEISLPDLLGIEAEVAQAHQTLWDGSGIGGGLRGWMDLPLQMPNGEVMGILAAADQIRYSSDILVVLGMGCTCLGAKAAIELLQGPNRNLGKGKGNPQIIFAGNSLSTRQWNELMKLLEGKDFSLCVISKSGTTMEPAIALRNLRWMLERKYGTDGARSRIYAITDRENGALRQMAEAEGWECFAIPSNADSRYCVLSPAGLLPMAVAGIDIMAVLRGAWEAKEVYNLRSFENPVWLYAAVRALMHRGGKTAELLESFEPGFAAMGRWWQQLFGMSGSKVFPIAAELTGDLYTQLIWQPNLFESVVRFEPSEADMVIGEDAKNLDALNYLAGKTLEDVAATAFDSAVETHTDSGVPMVVLECGQLTEETVGELFWFFQLSCSIFAYVLEENPFEKPGAEAYKQNLFRLLGRPEPEE